MTPTRRSLVAGLIALVVVVAGVVLVVRATSSAPKRHIDAVFAEAPGLFPGDHVDVLGVPVGSVTSVKPRPAGVDVNMDIDTSVKLPAGVRAVLMAPDVISDRFVALTPVYSGGATLGRGAVIATDHTAAPVSVDQVFGQLDLLAKQLGPSGANRNGALSSLLHGLATSFGGNGTNLHTTVVSLSQALDGLASNPAATTALLDNLGQLTQAAANNDTTYQAFANDLAEVSTQLAADNPDIASALSGLSQTFTELTAFVHDNQASLGSSLSNLQTFTTAIAAQQKSLAQAFDVGPLALANVNQAIDTSSGEGKLKARLFSNPASKALQKQVCGSLLYRGAIVVTNPPAGAESDLACVVGGALTALPVPPSAAAGPNLSLSALMGAQ